MVPFPREVTQRVREQELRRKAERTRQLKEAHGQTTCTPPLEKARREAGPDEGAPTDVVNRALAALGTRPGDER
jgi:hypothetical protein